MDLREQIDKALKPYTDPDDGTVPTWDSDGLQTWRPAHILRDELLAVVQPELDAKDTEIRRLNRKVEREQIIAKMAEQHAENAQAERDRLKAEVEHLIAEENERGPSCEYGKPCPYITGLRAALDQPGDQEGTT